MDNPVGWGEARTPTRYFFKNHQVFNAEVAETQRHRVFSVFLCGLCYLSVPLNIIPSCAKTLVREQDSELQLKTGGMVAFSALARWGS